MTLLVPAACLPQQPGPGRLPLNSVIVRAGGWDAQLCPAAGPGKSLLVSVFLGWSRAPRASSPSLKRISCPLRANAIFLFMTIAYLHEKSVHRPQTTRSQRSQPPGTRPGDPRGPPETWRGRMMAWVGDPGGQRWSPSRPGLSPLPSSAAATWPHLERPAGRSGPSSGGAAGSRTVTAPRCHMFLCPVGGVSRLFAEQSPAHEAAGTEPGAVLRQEGLLCPPRTQRRASGVGWP